VAPHANVHTVPRNNVIAAIQSIFVTALFDKTTELPGSGTAFAWTDVLFLRAVRGMRFFISLLSQECDLAHTVEGQALHKGVGRVGDAIAPTSFRFLSGENVSDMESFSLTLARVLP
jgi:hypothetical protein